MVSLGYQGSVAFIPVSLAALVFYTFPLLVGAVCGRGRTRSHDRRQGAALLAAFLGLALALGPEFGALDWRGIALALLAAVGMGLTMTFGGAATRNEDALLMSRLHECLDADRPRCLRGRRAAGFALPTTTLAIASTIGLCRDLCHRLCLLVSSRSASSGRCGSPRCSTSSRWSRSSSPGWHSASGYPALQFFGAALVLASVLSMSLTSSRRRRYHKRKRSKRSPSSPSPPAARPARQAFPRW